MYRLAKPHEVSDVGFRERMLAEFMAGRELAAALAPGATHLVVEAHSEYDDEGGYYDSMDGVEFYRGIERLYPFSGGEPREELVAAWDRLMALYGEDDKLSDDDEPWSASATSWITTASSRRPSVLRTACVSTSSAPPTNPRSFMSLTKQRKFVVMAQAYEYDDQDYTATAGGEPVTVFDDNADAQDEANERSITWLQTNDGRLEEYIWGGLDEDKVRSLNDTFNRNWSDERWLEWSLYGMSAWGAEKLVEIVDSLTPFYVLPVPVGDAA